VITRLKTKGTSESDVDIDSGDDFVEHARVEPGEETRDDADESAGEAVSEPATAEERAGSSSRRAVMWLTYGIIPVLIVGLAACAGYLLWKDSSLRAAQAASVSAVPAATDSTIKMLSYKPDTVQKDLEAAGEGLTGAFKDSYNALTHDVVIPGAQQKQISAVATVPAASVVSATAKRAVVMVFVNQTTIVGADPPTATASTVRVTLDKVGERWLVSDFTPI
jgi:Mce-associated membrane protein